MIQINLLPEELRKKRANIGEMFNKYKKYKIFVLPLTGVLSAAIGVIVLIIIVYPKIQSNRLNNLEGEWKKIEKQYEETAKIKKDLKKMQDMQDSIDKIIGERIVWAKKLNAISDNLPCEIQLTEVVTKIEKNKDKDDMFVLIIAGIVPSYPGEKAIGDFIKGLREDKDFMKSFPDIDPPSTVSTPEGFKKFAMKCYMTPEPKNQPVNGLKKKKDVETAVVKGKDKNEFEVK